MGEGTEGFGLEGFGHVEGLGEDAASVGFDADAAGALVALVGVAGDEAAFFHALKGGGDGVGVAGHEVGDGLLGEAARVALAEPAQDAVLVGREAEVGDALAEDLVQRIPRAPEQRGEAARRMGCGRWVFFHHGAEERESCARWQGLA